LKFYSNFVAGILFNSNLGTKFILIIDSKITSAPVGDLCYFLQAIIKAEFPKLRSVFEKEDLE
jgi:hypothetical protein